MSTDGESWFDEDAGPLVRPYTLTRGRTRASHHDLNMITMVITVSYSWENSLLEPEQVEIVRLCQQPLSVAEIAAKLDLPMAVVKVLLSDLIDQNLVMVQAPLPEVNMPDPELLQAVLDGIRKL